MEPHLPERSSEVWTTYFTVPAEDVLFSDEHVVVFLDRRPRAATHILVVPRHRAIRGVEALTPADRPLVEAMARAGCELALCDVRHMGFHQWPLRSVDHLHLHCLVPPFRTFWQRLRYMELPGAAAGFISLTSVLRRLARER